MYCACVSSDDCFNPYKQGDDGSELKEPEEDSEEEDYVAFPKDVDDNSVLGNLKNCIVILCCFLEI